MGKNVSTMNDVNGDCVLNPPIALNTSLGIDEAVKFVNSKEDSHHVSLSISCTDLTSPVKSKGSKTIKSNHFTVVYLSENDQTTWEHIGTTENISHDPNPNFVKRINLVYKKTVVQHIRFEVYNLISDVPNSETPILAQQALIGNITFQLGEIMESVDRTVKGDLSLRGHIEVYGSKITLEQNLALITLHPTNFAVGKYYLYVHTVHTSADHKEVYHPLYRSEVQDQNQPWNLVRIAYCYFYSPPVESYLGTLGRAVSSFGTTNFISPLKKQESIATSLPITPASATSPPPRATLTDKPSHSTPIRPANLSSTRSLLISNSNANIPKVAFEIKRLLSDGTMESLAMSVCNIVDLREHAPLDFIRNIQPSRLTTPKLGKSFSMFTTKTRNDECTGEETLAINGFRKQRVPTFMEYLTAGVQVNVLIAVDCSGPNHPSSNPEPFHYINPDCDLKSLSAEKSNVSYQEHFRRLNPYQQAICSIGEIIESYDDDKHFPVLGFGGIKINNSQARLNQYFYLDSEKKASFGKEGILELYTNTIPSITPTTRNLSKLVAHISSLVEAKQNEPIVEPNQMNESEVKQTVLPIETSSIGIEHTPLTPTEAKHSPPTFIEANQINPPLERSDPAQIIPPVEAKQSSPTTVEKQNERNYFIVFIITNGSPVDMDETSKKIVLATTLPVSFVFIGVGTNGDFTGLKILDGDQTHLRDSQNRYALRDIVQFVNYNEYLTADSFNDQEFSRAILEEIPEQVVSYYLSKNIMPTDL